MKTKAINFIKILFWAPRIIVILAILFVSLFALDSFSNSLSIWQQLFDFSIHLIPSFILIAILFVAWKWELIGGVIFISLSLFFTPIIYIHNYKMNHSIVMSLEVILLITLPFFVAGILFIIYHFINKKSARDFSHSNLINPLFFLPLLFLFFSYKCTIPVTYIGNWQSANSLITVRSCLGLMKFNFTSDSASVFIKINADKTVSGNIGLAKINKGKLYKNYGPGVEYIVKCGSIGKIFRSDPLDNKKVELWILKMANNNHLVAELRYTENAAAFPMADLNFIKVEKEPGFHKY